MTDYGIPEADLAAVGAAFDRVWAEEAVRRAKDLADDLFMAVTDPSGCFLPGDPQTKAGELSVLIYRLGIHLDETAGYNITGGDAP